MAKPFDRIESEVKPLLELAELADRHKDPRILNWIKAGVIGRNPQVINSLKKRLVIDATNRLVERRYFTAPMMEELLAHADPVKSLILGQARDADLTVLYAVRLTHQHLLILVPSYIILHALYALDSLFEKPQQFPNYFALSDFEFVTLYEMYLQNQFQNNCNSKL